MLLWEILESSEFEKSSIEKEVMDVLQFSRGIDQTKKFHLETVVSDTIRKYYKKELKYKYLGEDDLYIKDHWHVIVADNRFVNLLYSSWHCETGYSGDLFEVDVFEGWKLILFGMMLGHSLCILRNLGLLDKCRGWYLAVKHYKSCTLICKNRIPIASKLPAIPANKLLFVAGMLGKMVPKLPFAGLED